MQISPFDNRKRIKARVIIHPLKYELHPHHLNNSPSNTKTYLVDGQAPDSFEFTYLLHKYRL